MSDNSPIIKNPKYYTEKDKNTVNGFYLNSKENAKNLKNSKKLNKSSRQKHSIFHQNCKKKTVRKPLGENLPKDNKDEKPHNSAGSATFFNSQTSTNSDNSSNKMNISFICS